MEIRETEPFIDYFEHVRGRTLRVARAVPAERMEWAPRPGTFSFGDILRHLGAIERFMFAENVLGRQSRYPGHGRDLADGFAETFAFLDRMHREALEIFRGLDAADLQRRCPTPGGISIPVWKWLRSMIEHEIHHRGQIYLMLNILEVPSPPLYGLTSEEVRDRSLRGAIADGDA